MSAEAQMSDLTKVLQGCGVSQLPKSTFVATDPSEIVRALVGLKDVQVLAYVRRGPDVELMIEQVVEQVRCPTCGDGPGSKSARWSITSISPSSARPCRWPGRSTGCAV